jgi:hypothetical protein
MDKNIISVISSYLLTAEEQAEDALAEEIQKVQIYKDSYVLFLVRLNKEKLAFS